MRENECGSLRSQLLNLEPEWLVMNTESYGTRANMKQLLEFLPLIIFFIVYQMSGTTLSVGDSEYTFDGIYTATIALILTTILQVIIVKLVWGSVEKRLLGVAGAVIIFGGATVLLKDPVFIFWKPTVFNWALAGVSVVWHVMRGKCLFEDLLPDEIEMPKTVEVTAWFTPQIPLGHGPGEYAGLPGLILELNADRTTLLCSKIIMNPKDLPAIDTPVKGTVVTQDEFERIVKEKTQEMRDNWRNRSGRRGRGE